MSVSFSKYYLATHTETSCIKFSTSEVRAAPFVSCPTGRQKGHPIQHHQHPHSTCRSSFEVQFMPSVTSHTCEGQQSPSLGPSTSKRLPRVQSRGSNEPGTRPACASWVLLWEGHRSEVSAGTAVVHPSKQHSTKCCCAELPAAQAFPKHTERCWVLFGLRLNTNGTQVAGYPKM